MRYLVLAMLVGCGSSATMEPAPDAPPAPADRATGEIGAWAQQAPLPVARANHCSAAIGDWVLVIGGNYKDATTGQFVKTDTIHAARVGADGAIGAWHVAGHTPSPVSECNATSDGQRLYVIDGLYDTAADAGKIFTADLDDAGMLAPLVAMGALPDGVIAISSEAAVRGGALLLMDTRLPSDPDGDKTVTMHTPLTTVSWSTDDWKIGFRARAQYAFTDRFAFTLGGYLGDASNTVTAAAFTAPIGAGGAIGASHPTTALAIPTTFGRAVAADDWLVIAGGRGQVFGAAGTTAVAVAHVETDGSLASWQAMPALPIARTNHALALAGDFLVLTGGAVNGPGDATVLTARVRYPR